MGTAPGSNNFFRFVLDRALHTLYASQSGLRANLYKRHPSRRVTKNGQATAAIARKGAPDAIARHRVELQQMSRKTKVLMSIINFLLGVDRHV
jgi:hypothetical protein